jgi:hypothetical protein
VGQFLARYDYNHNIKSAGVHCTDVKLCRC